MLCIRSSVARGVFSSDTIIAGIICEHDFYYPRMKKEPTENVECGLSRRIIFHLLFSAPLGISRLSLLWDVASEELLLINKKSRPKYCMSIPNSVVLCGLPSTKKQLREFRDIKVRNNVADLHYKHTQEDRGLAIIICILANHWRNAKCNQTECRSAARWIAFIVLVFMHCCVCRFVCDVLSGGLQRSDVSLKKQTAIVIWDQMISQREQRRSADGYCNYLDTNNRWVICIAMHFHWQIQGQEDFLTDGWRLKLIL